MTTKIDQHKCGLCVAWNPSPDTTNCGTCHLESPVVGDLGGIWPETVYYNFCVAGYEATRKYGPVDPDIVLERGFKVSGNP